MSTAHAKLSAYNTVAIHGGVAAANPHGMVTMLLDAAAERMTTACTCIEHKEQVRKAKLLHSCVVIIAELRGSLNLVEGGALAQNLDALYDYMTRQLILANLQSDVAKIKEVLGLLGDIRSAWIAIGPMVKTAGATAATRRLPQQNAPAHAL